MKIWECLVKSVFNENLGLLSIDIDGNDYWILKELKHILPDIIICEYNSLLGEKSALTLKYDEKVSPDSEQPADFVTEKRFKPSKLEVMLQPPLNAKVFGETIDLKKHEFKVEIKSPTFHEMEIEENEKVRMKYLLDL